jgi:hypothetical protein
MNQKPRILRASVNFNSMKNYELKDTTHPHHSCKGVEPVDRWCVIRFISLSMGQDKVLSTYNYSKFGLRLPAPADQIFQF